MLAKAAWDAENSFVEINDMLANGGMIRQVLFKAFTDTESLTPFEMNLVHRFMSGVWQRTEAQYALYTNEILDTEVWHLRRDYSKSLMNNVLLNDIWHAEKMNSMFTRAFISEIDQAESRQGPTFLGVAAPVAQSADSK